MWHRGPRYQGQPLLMLPCTQTAPSPAGAEELLFWGGSHLLLMGSMGCSDGLSAVLWLIALAWASLRAGPCSCRYRPERLEQSTLQTSSTTLVHLGGCSVQQPPCGALCTVDRAGDFELWVLECWKLSACISDRTLTWSVHNWQGIALHAKGRHVSPGQGRAEARKTRTQEEKGLAPRHRVQASLSRPPARPSPRRRCSRRPTKSVFDT